MQYGRNRTADLEVMLTVFTRADRVYIVCGYTDLCYGIDGLAGIVQRQFNLNPESYGRLPDTCV